MRLNSRTGWMLLSILALLGFAAFAAYRGQQSLIHSHTLAMGRMATAMVKEYVETHDGRWPTSWEALATLDSESPQISPSIKQRVVIDFTADPARLARQRKEAFIAIRPVKEPFGDYRDYWEIDSLLEALRQHHPRKDE